MIFDLPSCVPTNNRSASHNHGSKKVVVIQIQTCSTSMIMGEIIYIYVYLILGDKFIHHFTREKTTRSSKNCRPCPLALANICQFALDNNVKIWSKSSPNHTTYAKMRTLRKNKYKTGLRVWVSSFTMITAYRYQTMIAVLYTYIYIYMYIWPKNIYIYNISPT